MGATQCRICFGFSRTGCIWICRFGKKGLKSNTKSLSSSKILSDFSSTCFAFGSQAAIMHVVMEGTFCHSWCSAHSKAHMLWCAPPPCGCFLPSLPHTFHLLYSGWWIRSKGPDITSLPCLVLPPVLHFKFYTASERLAMGPGNNSAR